MKQSTETILSFIATVLVSIFLITVLYFFIHFFLCFNAAKRLPNVIQYPLMRVVVFGSSYEKDTATVSARISLLDSDSTEFAVIERSWKGTSLSVSFLSSSFSGKKIWFPFKVYGNDFSNQEFFNKSRGTKLFSYYNENGESLLFGKNNSTKTKKDFFLLATYALISRFKPTNKYSEEKIINLSECETGVSYTIYTGFDGRLFIQ